MRATFWITAVLTALLWTAQAEAQRGRDAFVIEFEPGEALRARDLANEIVAPERRVLRADERAIILQPNALEEAQLEEAGRFRFNDLRREGLIVRRIPLDPDTIFIAGDRFSLLTPQEQSARARLEERVGPVTSVWRPNTQWRTSRALSEDTTIELPVQTGELQTFRASLPPVSSGGVSAWAGVTRLANGVQAYVELSEQAGVLSGTLHSANETYSIRRMSDSLYALIRREDTPAPDHPGSLDSSTPRAAAPTTAPAALPTCPAGPSLDVLVLVTKAASETADTSRALVADPSLELFHALRYSEMTSFSLTMPFGIVDLGQRYTDDATKSECQGLGDCQPGQTRWLRHLEWLVARGNDRSDAIYQQRRLRNADIVVMLVRDGRVCGAVPTAAVETYARRETAFAVVSTTCLMRSTLAHEIAHLLGSRHDVEARQGATNFAYAFQNPTTGWATIGAVSCPSAGHNLCPRVANGGGRFAYPSMPTMFPPTASTPSLNDPLRDERGAIIRFGPCVARFGENIPQ